MPPYGTRGIATLLEILYYMTDHIMTYIRRKHNIICHSLKDSILYIRLIFTTFLVPPVTSCQKDLENVKFSDIQMPEKSSIAKVF